MTSAELAAQQALRAQLLDGLSSIMSNSDVDSSSLINAADALASIVRTQYDITAQSSQQVADLAHSILTQSNQLNNPMALDIANLLHPVDAAMAAVLAPNSGASSNTLHNLSSVVYDFQDLLVKEQQNFDAVYNSFRITTQVYENAGSSNASLSVPIAMTDAEKALASIGQLSVPSLTIKPSQNGNTSSGSVYVSVVLLDQKQWKDNTTRVSSDFVSIRVNNVDSVDISIVPKVQPTGRAINYTISCPPRIKVKRNFTCPDSGQVMFVQCNGTSGSFTGFCPVLMQTCAALNVNGYALGGQSCSATNANRSSNGAVTCHCVMGLSGPNGVVAAGLVMNYVGSDLSHTFQASSAFGDASAITKTYIILALYSSLWGCSLAAMFYFQWGWGKAKNDDISKGGISLSASAKIKRAARGVVSPHELVVAHESASLKEKKPSEARKKLAEYIALAFPMIFEAKSFLSGLKHELVQHHLYFNFFFQLKHSKSPVLIVIKMMTIQSFTLFLLALLYDLNYPDDDGTCPLKTDMQSCLARKYMMDTTRTYCSWVELGDESNCIYAEPSFSLTTALYVSMIISFATCISMEPLEVMTSMLAAPNLAPQVNALHVHVDHPAEEQNYRTDEEGPKEEALAPAEPVEAVIPSKPPGGRVLRRAPTIRYIPTTVVAAHQDMLDYTQLIVNQTIPLQDRRQLQRRQLVKRISLRFQTASSNRKLEMDPLVRSFKALHAELLLQRQLLPPEAGLAFDEAWGLNSQTADFLERQSDHWWSGKHTINAGTLINHELVEVTKQAHEVHHCLRTANDVDKGFEILHVFVKDLLGRNTPAARIFASKAELDFEKIAVSAPLTKVCIACFLFMLNSFFVYYTILKAYTKGLTWQVDYTQAWIAQLLLDVLLFETIQCVWIHLVLPSLVSKEVNAVFLLLQATVDHLYDASYHEDGTICLNAPDYLFVSYRLAGAFPDLLESRIVKSYVNHLPGEAGKVWLKKLKQRHVDHPPARSFRMGNIFPREIVVRAAAYAPLQLQRLLMRVIEPALLSGLTLAFFYLIKRPMYLVGFFGAILILIAALTWDYYRNKARRLRLPAVVLPDASHDNGQHLPIQADSADSADTVDNTPLHLELTASKGKSGRTNKAWITNDDEDSDAHFSETNSIDIPSLMNHPQLMGSESDESKDSSFDSDGSLPSLFNSRESSVLSSLISTPRAIPRGSIDMDINAEGFFASLAASYSDDSGSSEEHNVDSMSSDSSSEDDGQSSDNSSTSLDSTQRKYSQPDVKAAEAK